MERHTGGLGSTVMACVSVPFDRMPEQAGPTGEWAMILGGTGLRVGLKHSVRQS